MDSCTFLDKGKFSLQSVDAGCKFRPKGRRDFEANAKYYIDCPLNIVPGDVDRPKRSKPFWFEVFANIIRAPRPGSGFCLSSHRVFSTVNATVTGDATPQTRCSPTRTPIRRWRPTAPAPDPESGEDTTAVPRAAVTTHNPDPRNQTVAFAECRAQ